MAGRSRVATKCTSASRRSAADFTHPIHLPFRTRSFDTNTRTSVTPPAEVTDEGWFALTELPPSWDEAGPTDDGLRNFLAPGEGLGSGDDPEALLDKIPGVTPLRATGLNQLQGQTVCR